MRNNFTTFTIFTKPRRRDTGRSENLKVQFPLSRILFSLGEYGECGELLWNHEASVHQPFTNSPKEDRRTTGRAFSEALGDMGGKPFRINRLRTGTRLNIFAGQNNHMPVFTRDDSIITVFPQLFSMKGANYGNKD